MMLIFSLTVTVSILLVAGWVIMCVYRLCFSDEVSSIRDSRQNAEFLYDDDAVPVGVREIYEQQYHDRSRREVVEYSYERGSRANLPSAWWEDLRQRRN